MALTYGFYNSLNGDRKYDAIQMSSIFDGIIKDGVYETIGDAFIVKLTDGMNMTVGTGRAWFDHTWTLNDSLYPITIDSAEAVKDRFDAVVIEVNESTRTNSIKVVKGEAADNPVKPTLTKSDTVHQYPLAYIRVKAGLSTLSQSNLENKVGTSECPFVIGVLKILKIDDIIANWSSQWKDWLAAQDKSYSDWMSSSKSEFETWFNDLKVNLDENVAANLQNQLTDLNAKLDLIISGGTVEDNLLDSTGANVLDSSGNPIKGSTVYTPKSKETA